MGIWQGYLDLVSEVSRAKRGLPSLAQRRQYSQGVIGTPITREETFVGMDVDEPAGQHSKITTDPQTGRAMVANQMPNIPAAMEDPNYQTTQQASGWLGSGRSADDQLILQKGLIDSGYTPNEVTGIMKTPELGTQVSPGQLDIALGRQGMLEQPDASATEGSGLLGDPYNPAVIEAYRTAALGSGRKNESINKTIEAAQRVGKFKNRKEHNEALTKLQVEHEKRINAPRDSLNTYERAESLVEDRGGFAKLTGPDDLALITYFAKMQRPGEALNEGDVSNIINTGSGLEWMRTMLNKVDKGGVLDPKQRAKIMQAMGSMAKTSRKRYDDVRDRTGKQFESFGFETGTPTPMLPGSKVFNQKLNRYKELEAMGGR